MAKPKKKPQYVIDLLESHHESLVWWGSILIKKRDPNIAPHLAPIYAEMSEDLLVGMMEGANVIMEKLLHATGTYAGFAHRHLDDTPIAAEEFYVPYEQKPWVADKAVAQMRHYF